MRVGVRVGPKALGESLRRRLGDRQASTRMLSMSFKRPAAGPLLNNSSAQVAAAPIRGPRNVAGIPAPQR